MKTKLLIVIVLIHSVLFNIQVYAEPFEYYVTLQIDSSLFNYKFGERPNSIQPLDKDDPSVKPFIHEDLVMLPMRAVVNTIIVDGPPGWYYVEWNERERKASIVPGAPYNPQCNYCSPK